jgi:predicted  nucleic acid-binding Zn-ribbon protein
MNIIFRASLLGLLAVVQLQGEPLKKADLEKQKAKYAEQVQELQHRDVQLKQDLQDLQRLKDVAPKNIKQLQTSEKAQSKVRAETFKTGLDAAVEKLNEANIWTLLPEPERTNQKTLFEQNIRYSSSTGTRTSWDAYLEVLMDKVRGLGGANRALSALSTFRKEITDLYHGKMMKAVGERIAQIQGELNKSDENIADVNAQIQANSKQLSATQLEIQNIDETIAMHFPSEDDLARGKSEQEGGERFKDLDPTGKAREEALRKFAIPEPAAEKPSQKGLFDRARDAFSNIGERIKGIGDAHKFLKTYDKEYSSHLKQQSKDALEHLNLSPRERAYHTHIVHRTAIHEAIKRVFSRKPSEGQEPQDAPVEMAR